VFAIDFHIMCRASGGRESSGEGGRVSSFCFIAFFPFAIASSDGDILINLVYWEKLRDNNSRKMRRVEGN
jgi:hypothetical protein